MKNNDKLDKAIAIFKEAMPDAKGRYKAYISETNSNEVEIFQAGFGYYCTVNIRSRKLKDI